MFLDCPKTQFLWILELEICDKSGFAETREESEALGE